MSQAPRRMDPQGGQPPPTLTPDQQEWLAPFGGTVASEGSCGAPGLEATLAARRSDHER